MRRVPSNVQHAVTGILSALAVTAVVAATRSPDGGSATRVATMGGNFAGDPGVEVALVLSGDVGQYAGMCGALSGGTDSLAGTLVREGSGPVASDEDVMYRGLLARKTNISACGTSRRPRRTRWPCAPPPSWAARG